MSRIGQKPVTIPVGVEISVSEDRITVRGVFGELHRSLPGAGVSVVVEPGLLRVIRHDESAKGRAIHGLTRALIFNMVQGVNVRFEKRLELQGVGYQASLMNGRLSLNVGFSHPVVLFVPLGIDCVLSDATHLLVRGADRALVGQFAADVRGVRPQNLTRERGSVTLTNLLGASRVRPLGLSSSFKWNGLIR